MSRQQQFALMGRYNRDMNQRLFAAASKLEDSQLRSNMGAFFQSILGTLNHLYVADVMWLKRFAVGPFTGAASLDSVAAIAKPTAINQMIYSDLDTFLPARKSLDITVCNWTEALQEVDLDRPFTYKNSKDADFCKPFGLVLQHFFNHQTHHRGQLTTLLSQQGVDVGVTDLLLWIDELAPEPLP
ncbi:putative damage-inducible protein DinB [Zhongshania antarctica]|uniref:Putative damage-inducible protein DinB n=1 Tax=Zhongshania antarctica TaxID=641702 RepID=A0A840R5Z3_9GAMM|nr:DinB family protein [Zhongshania antarctica]MBB5187913.1 putative damage-inducible protein DinB [Zhongshania antarctica]